VIPEAAVIALAAALYLLDCVVLLERGQALWSRTALMCGPFDALSFGSNHYQIRGKVVALLNPLTPFIPVFRTLPLFSRASNVRLSRAIQSLTPTAAMSMLQFVLLFVALPYCLYRAPGWPFFISLVLAYLNAIAMLGFICWSFRAAGIATRPLIGLGFAWLACLPLSVNALRKAGLAFDVALDARQAVRVLPERAQERARSDLAAQIGEAMQELEEADERHHRLAELKRQLTKEIASERV
jgi:signal transduction histidine kinase